MLRKSLNMTAGGLMFQIFFLLKTEDSGITK